MEELSNVWNQIRLEIKKELSDASFDLWFADIKFVRMDFDTIIVTSPHAFKKNIVETKFMDILRRAGQRVLGFSVKYQILVEGEEPPKEIADALLGISSEENGGNVYTFDNFIKGPSNAFAYSAALNVAKNPGKNYNPLFIYGRSGVGKTHLMNAIKNYIMTTRPGAKIMYFTGEHFVNEFIDCIKKNNNQVFREKYRGCDVLLLDDIQYIIGKNQTQEEFFHTFNALKTDGKQIVLTSDVAPKDLRGIPDRLVSRFEEGIITDIGMPELETRVAIIKQKAEQMDIEMTDETALYIAENVRKNIRQIEGIVKKIKAYSEFTGADANSVVAKGFIEEISTDTQPVEVQIEGILKEVGNVYNVTVEDLKSTRRNASIAFPRHVAMYVISKTTSLTQDEIGKFFGGKDHSSIIYAIKTVANKMETDQAVRSTVNDLLASFS